MKTEFDILDLPIERPEHLLFQAEEVRFSRFLEREPPPRRMILENVLPLGVTGLVAAAGGVGKSQLLYQMGISVAAGTPLFGLAVQEPGSALILAAEDDEDELHRRGFALMRHFGLSEVQRARVAERLHIVPRVAEDNLLTRRVDGELHRTALVNRIIEAAIRIPDLKMIALDPTSRFRGGQANDEEDATRFVEAMEAIRAATGATVLTAPHVNKGSLREPGGGQEIVRGSTALVDGVRWVATLQRLRRDAAKDYGVPEDDADRYLRLEIPKSNYTAPFPGLWLRREAGGVLVPTTLERKVEARKQERVNETYLATLGKVQELVRKEPMTARYVEKTYSGTAGVLGVGEKAVRGIIQRALDAGDLVHLKGSSAKGGGHLLGIPGGEE